ncbi:MAG: hypothetical protein HY898_36745 [Deltaproteobacteria bacterium]|nr:hypothetical protein [Deltaproteobacteria bacterium]
MTQPNDPEDKPAKSAEAADAQADDEEERAAEERRERAEHTRKAQERAAASLKAEQERKAEKGKRRWYHWLIDIALFAVAGYLIWTRFLAPKNQPAPPPEPSASMSSAAPGASGAPLRARVIVNPTQVRQGPGELYAPAEVLSAAVRAEILDQPQGGWVKIRLGPSREGFVPISAIADQPKRPDPKR